MKIRTTAPKRKDVVKVMEEVAGQKSMYLGPPTFAYQVGDFILDRDGVIETELTSEGMRMKMELIQKGFAADDAEETEATEEAEVTIQLPMYGHTAESIRNLLFMIHSKQYLLAKSIGEQVLKISEGLVEKLNEKKELTLEEVLDCFEKEKGNCVGIDFADGRICFTAFPMDEERTRIFMELVSKMAESAKGQKRVNPKETIEENEKYYMRVWLMRIGFGGRNGKEVRTVLLRNLKGHSAFRTEEEIERAKEKNHAKREAEKAE